ncbi:parallel beta helix pectate lyase-like protein [Jejuia pallidilutea]|uniref:Parallel beta helix pectate lyase-like protein n=1 Tax=Jejuia pallidilutea TaxID=504487 RepID=A0A362X504_9FLAO|nr:right-handed parallel beta-helix repeat-containing protein [Jejuia pallidilutea]PQV51529.1 parallel beta helix pectate lyase-like protein [Jejuia pallidilutea]
MKKLVLIICLVFQGFMGFSQIKNDNTLPDGTALETWKDNTKYEKIYYVDTNNPKASDDSPGTFELPFKTIGKAAEVVKPKQKVIVKEGIYREKVTPRFGGESDEAMISYEAAPNEKVIITGAEKLITNWSQPDIDLFKKSLIKSETLKKRVWSAKIPFSYFEKGNPFARINLTSWMFSHLAKSQRNAFNLDGMGQYFALKRGLMFIEGNRITQVPNYKDLAESEEDTVFWVEDDGLTIHLKTAEGINPNALDIEITTREQCFAPEEVGTGFIKIKGFTFEKGGNPFPIDQKGLLSTNAGHHWIIENNTVQWANGIGVDIGIGHWTKAKPEISGYHIVRNNTFLDNGICGLAGNAIYYTIIENNYLERNAFYPVEKYFENAAIKTHHNINTIIRNNKIIDTKFGSGIWMDYGNVNSRCTNNFIQNTNSMFGAIFMEGSVKRNLVDNNFVVESTSSGIYQHDCDSLLVVNNLVVNARKSGIRMSYHPERRMFGKLAQMKNNVIASNIIIASDTIFSMKDTDNIIDYNYVSKKHNAMFEHPDEINPNWNKHIQIVEMDLKIVPHQNTQNPKRIEITFPNRKFEKNIYQLNQVPGPKGIFRKKDNTLSIPINQGLEIR